MTYLRSVLLLLGGGFMLLAAINHIRGGDHAITFADFCLGVLCFAFGGAVALVLASGAAG